MTSGPELPERDPALERAWRAQSRETPPVELDRAILAAAHRAVGSGPREASQSPEAKQPQRWWMPLAAAATIGAVAVGLLQLTPQDAGIVAPTERIAAVAPRQDGATSDRKAEKEMAPADVRAQADKPQAGRGNSARHLRRRAPLHLCPDLLPQLSPLPVPFPAAAPPSAPAPHRRSGVRASPHAGACASRHPSACAAHACARADVVACACACDFTAAGARRRGERAARRT